MRKSFFATMLVGLLFPSVLFTQTASPQDIKNSLNDFADPTGIEQVGLTEAAGGAVEVVYSVMGIIFFVLAIYAGITWMTAQGKEDTIAKARNMLISATIGLTIVVGAYGITTFISERAIGDLSTGGSSQEVETTVGDSEADGPVCCIIRMSNRRREFAAVPVQARNECGEAIEAQSAISGSDIDEGEDWQYYGDVQYGEECTILETCWERTNEGNRTTCIESVISD